MGSAQRIANLESTLANDIESIVIQGAISTQSVVLGPFLDGLGGVGTITTVVHTT